MQYVAAYTLAALSCDKPTKDAVIAILKATGKPVDDAQVDALFKATGDRSAHEVLMQPLSSSPRESPRSDPSEAQELPPLPLPARRTPPPPLGSPQPSLLR